MNLPEMFPTVNSEEIDRQLFAQFGKGYNFASMNLKESKIIAEKAERALNKYKDVNGTVGSENDPTYVKLLLVKEAADKRVSEVKQITQETRMNNKYVKALKKVAQGGSLSESDLRGLKVTKGLRAVLEDRNKALLLIKRIIENKKARGRQLNEAEIDSAQVVLAAQDIADQVQQMIEKFADIQYKELPALNDGIRKEFGTETADSFNASVLGSLQELTGSLEAAKSDLNGAVGMLTGDEPMGADLDVGGFGDEEMGDEDMGLGDEEMDTGADTDEFDLDFEEPEEEDDLTDLGREKR